MALSVQDKDRLYAALMRSWSDVREACAFLKTDLRTAVDETDAWIEANQADRRA